MIVDVAERFLLARVERAIDLFMERFAAAQD